MNSQPTPLRRAAWWCGPPLICLLIHWRALASWFRADDFAWLALHPTLHDFFAPMAQGTLRPLGDRLFFIAGFGLFGLDALPFHLIALATQFANLALVASIGTRLTGRRAAGFLAAALWATSHTAVLPLGWASAYNQVLCAFFLLLAFWFLLRWVETGESRFYVFQWLAFLLGFGAMELNIVYPALAAAYALFVARPYLKRVLPLFVPSIVYFAIHQAVAPAGRDPVYTLHFTGAMLRTLAKYWAWSVGPLGFWAPIAVPKWLVPTAVVVVSLGLLAFAAAHRRTGAFCLVWFGIAIAPVLPLRDHITEYYPFVPVIGLCWLGGWALVEAWGASAGKKVAGVALAAIYLAIMLPRTIASSEFNRRVTGRVHDLVDGVARAHELHPGQAILLDGVDTELFYNGPLEHPFRLLGIDRVYLTPESAEQIESHPELGDAGAFVMPAAEIAKGLDSDSVAVCDARLPVLRNITSKYAGQLHDLGLPRRVEVAGPFAVPLLGAGWYATEGNHRWMGKHAGLRLAGPAAAGQKLYLRGYYPADELRSGPVTISVSVNGSPLAPGKVSAGGDFEAVYSLPDALVGQPSIEVAIEVSRTFRAGGDMRDLGLAFGEIEIH